MRDAGRGMGDTGMAGSWECDCKGSATMSGHLRSAESQRLAAQELKDIGSGRKMGGEHSQKMQRFLDKLQSLELD